MYLSLYKATKFLINDIICNSILDFFLLESIVLWSHFTTLGLSINLCQELYIIEVLQLVKSTPLFFCEYWSWSQFLLSQCYNTYLGTHLFVYMCQCFLKSGTFAYRYKHLNLHRELNGWGFIRSDWNSSSALGSIFMKTTPRHLYLGVLQDITRSNIIPISSHPFLSQVSPFHNLVPSFLF